MESRLKEIDTISDVQSATEDNDPNQGLNKQGSYTAAVYFSDNEVTNPVAGADLVAKGTDAGGCVEVYKTVEDAKKRNDYLSAFDGLPTVINPGSHYVYGTVVIRVAASLTASQQNALTQKIYEKLIEIKDDSTSKNSSKTEIPSSTKPSSSSSSSTQATVSESAQSNTKTVAGSAPTTPAQQQDPGVTESSKETMLNPEYHSHIDENGYNSLLGAYVLDNNNGETTLILLPSRQQQKVLNKLLITLYSILKRIRRLLKTPIAAIGVFLLSKLLATLYHLKTSPK